MEMDTDFYVIDSTGLSFPVLRVGENPSGKSADTKRRQLRATSGLVQMTVQKPSEGRVVFSLKDWRLSSEHRKSGTQC